MKNAAFNWNADFDWKKLRIGYNVAKFERAADSDLSPKPKDDNAEAMKGWLSEKAYLATRQYDNRFDRAALTFERWGAGDGKVILGNSGFEAVEAALKTSLLRTGKAGVIAFTGGYHGLGFGALTATALPF